MSTYKDVRGCAGGIDTDSDIRDIDSNDYLLESINLNSGVSIKGTLLNIKGNLKINHTLPNGKNKTIGALRNIKQNAIIYFVFNDQGQHSILHFFCATNTIEEILAPSAALPVTGLPFDTSFLGFTEFNKIHSAFIIDDILVWTDGNVPPRKINIKYARDFMLQLTPSAVNKPYSNLLATGVNANKEQFVNFIKYAPLVPASIALATDLTKSTNFIRNQMIQVRYRWIYDDSEKSCWNTGSYITLPQGQENFLGLIAVNVQNNYIAVTYNTGHPTVRKIDLSFRFNNLGNWLRLDEPINKFNDDNVQILPDYTDEVFNFYNDRVLIPVDVADTDKNFDAVPEKTGTLDIIDGNRAVMACNTEGLENPELNILMNFGNTLIPLLKVDTTSIVKIKNGVVDPSVGNAIAFPFTNPNISSGDVISLIFNCPPQSFSGTINYTVTENDLVNYPFSLCDNLLRYIRVIIGANIGTVVTTTIPGSLYRAIVFIFSDGNQFNLAEIIHISQKITSFKKGAYHKFGVLYSNFANKDGGVATNPKFVQYIKTFPELFTNSASPVSLDDTNVYQSFIDIFIYHLPPVWAVKWQPVMAHSNLSKYVQFILKEHSMDAVGSGNIELDLTYLIDYKEKTLVTGSLNFQFEMGDRLRFISNAQYYCPQYVEVPVLSFNSTNNILTVGFFEKQNVIGNMATPVVEGVQVEYFAYSANADPENEFYFEIGDVYDVIAAGTPQRRHAGSVDGVPSNQVPASNIPAQIRLRRGDTYEYRRFFTTSKEGIFESENYSDFYQSANFDISRVQGVRNEITKQHGQQLRYGGRYFADTLTNNLNSFDGANFDTLQTTYGNIVRIMTIGYVLKVLQFKKITSIYINRQMIFNADGSSQVTLINDVLGTKDPSNSDFGCQDATSVCKDERQMFFYDRNTGTVVQDSANGLFAISNYKMIKGLKDKTQQLNSTSGNIFVYASVDNLISTLNISFVNEDDPTSPINDTYIYNTNDNRWKPRQSYIPDYVCSNALVFVSFSGGDLYVHNANELRNNFYGVQYDAVLVTVSNVQPTEVKVFDDMWQQSTKLFSCPNIGDLNILPTPNYPLGMSSRAVAGRWVAKEGKLYTDILRNALTPNQPSTDLALQNGDKMRGQALKVTLRNSDSDELTLYGIIINSTKSDIS